MHTNKYKISINQLNGDKMTNSTEDIITSDWFSWAKIVQVERENKLESKI